MILYMEYLGLFGTKNDSSYILTTYYSCTIGKQNLSLVDSTLMSLYIMFLLGNTIHCIYWNTHHRSTSTGSSSTNCDYSTTTTTAAIYFCTSYTKRCYQYYTKSGEEQISTLTTVFEDEILITYFIHVQIQPMHIAAVDTLPSPIITV